MQKTNVGTNTLERSVPSVKAVPAQEKATAPTFKEANDKGKQARRKNNPMVEVEFKLAANGAMSVSVAGSFNEWDAKKTPLKKSGDCWINTVELPRGCHEYLFVVDGRWMNDPNATESIANPFGGSNSLLSI